MYVFAFVFIIIALNLCVALIVCGLFYVCTLPSFKAWYMLDLPLLCCCCCVTFCSPLGLRLSVCTSFPRTNTPTISFLTLPAVETWPTMRTCSRVHVSTRRSAGIFWSRSERSVLLLLLVPSSSSAIAIYAIISAPCPSFYNLASSISLFWFWSWIFNVLKNIAWWDIVL